MIARYSSPEIQEIWDDKNRFRIWLDIELAALKAFEKNGDAPKGTFDKLKASLGDFPSDKDVAAILEIEKVVKHDVIAFLTRVEEAAGEDTRFLHLGMTSSDILDTCLAIQMRDSGQIILKSLGHFHDILTKKAIEFKGQPIMGRSHGIHAEPTSLGLVFLSFREEIGRCASKLELAINNISQGMISGAVGNFAHLKPNVEEIVCQELGLNPCFVSTQVIPRDLHTEYFNALAFIASAIERVSVSFRHFQRTEVREVFEPFGKGQKGSSAMPHKKNPILSENLCGLARIVRNNANTSYENIPLWHERDISHSSVERVIGPDSTTLTNFMLKRVSGMVENCVVDPVALKHNIGLTHGVFFSQVLLNELARRELPRQVAYKMVQRNAIKAFEERKTFRDLALADEEILGYINKDEIQDLLSMERYQQNVDHIFDRCQCVLAP